LEKKKKKKVSGQPQRIQNCENVDGGRKIPNSGSSSTVGEKIKLAKQSARIEGSAKKTPSFVFTDWGKKTDTATL